jgi:sensor histidine kinase YesM
MPPADAARRRHSLEIIAMTAATPRTNHASADTAPCEPAGHPLELFPPFRRISRSIPRDIVYTLIFNTIFALVFSVLNTIFVPSDSLRTVAWSNFVFANCIGFIIQLEFTLTAWLFPSVFRHGTAIRAAHFSLLAIIGVFAGYWLATEILHYPQTQGWIFTPRGVLAIGGMSLLISTVLLLIFIPRERAARMEAAVERERSRVVAAEREVTLARLKLLEAQVEPHFLYNTLANVVSLVDSNPATAKLMLNRLITLLRGAAVAAGGAEVTLGAQVAHLRAYLELLALRMGPRLVYRLEVDPGLTSIALPPLLLQPVVENAIRHGLEPRIEGGEIVVTARRTGAGVELGVVDTGIGFRDVRVATGTEGGVGLANLRARLVALYGGAASIGIEENAPHGTRVTIRLPV